MLTKKGTTKGTTYCIVNYTDWKDRVQQKGQQRNIEGTSKEHKQECIKNDKEHYSFVSEIINIWNEIFNTKIRITEGRRPKIKKRWVEWQCMDTVKTIFEKIKSSEFCMGATGWKADFDWIIKNDTNWVKVLEGKYDHAIKQKTELTDKEKEEYRQVMNCARNNPGCTKSGDPTCEKYCPIIKKRRQNV